MNNFKAQSGRSMIEMLGVLAVIGVLSVGGVVGYTTAMNKHSANEVMDALTKRAVAISDQLTRNPTGIPDLDEFTDKPSSCNGCKFTADNVAPEEGIFKISVSKLPQEICKQMLSLVSENALVRTVQPNSCDNELNAIDFYFTDDLSDDDIEINDIEESAGHYTDSASCGTYATTGRTWCSKLGTSGQCVQGNDCCSGMTISVCSVCNSSTGAITNASNTTPCKTTSTSTANDGKCDGNGTCIPLPACKTSGESCSSNDTCCSGYYCKMTNATTGTCQTLTNGTTYTGTTYRLGPKLNYWSAKNWCLAHNQDLVSGFQGCFESGDTCVRLAFNMNQFLNKLLGVSSALAAPNGTGAVPVAKIDQKIVEIIKTLGLANNGYHRFWCGYRYEGYYASYPTYLNISCSSTSCVLAKPETSTVSAEYPVLCE